MLVVCSRERMALVEPSVDVELLSRDMHCNAWCAGEFSVVLVYVGAGPQRLYTYDCVDPLVGVLNSGTCTPLT